MTAWYSAPSAAITAAISDATVPRNSPLKSTTIMLPRPGISPGVCCTMHTGRQTLPKRAAHARCCSPANSRLPFCISTVWQYSTCSVHRCKITAASTVVTRWVALALVPVMIGAAWFGHASAGFFFSNAGGGWEFPAFWAIVLVAQSLLGDGAFAAGRRFAR